MGLFDEWVEKEYKKKYNYKSLIDRWGSEKKLVYLLKFLKQSIDEVESELDYLHHATGLREEALLKEWKERTLKRLDKLTKSLDEIL